MAVIKILFLDDGDESAAIRPELEAFLGDWVVDWRAGDSVQAGLREVERWAPSVVIIDTHVSDLSDFEILQNLSTSGAPVIVKGSGRNVDVERAVMQNGVYAYVAPVDRENAAEKLGELILQAVSEPRFQGIN
jgi:DNA-binding NtrC family response regulator